MAGKFRFDCHHTLGRYPDREPWGVTSASGISGLAAQRIRVPILLVVKRFLLDFRATTGQVHAPMSSWSQHSSQDTATRDRHQNGLAWHALATPQRFFCRSRSETGEPKAAVFPAGPRCTKGSGTLDWQGVSVADCSGPLRRQHLTFSPPRRPDATHITP